MIDPWKAYETLLDWVYFKAKVATIRSITAADGSYGASEPEIGFVSFQQGKHGLTSLF
jgi:hypothetical protein